MTTPEELDRLRKQRLWEAHLAKLEAAKKPKRAKPSPEEVKAKRDETIRRWKAENLERVRELARERYRRKAAAMTPEEREAHNARQREGYRKRMADPDYRARRNAKQRERYALKRAASAQKGATA